MSSTGGIELIIRSLASLLQAIGDLRLACEEKKEMQTTDGKIYNVDVVVKDENNRSIGFQKQKDGSYRIIADSYGLNSAQLKKQQEFINKIKRRYAYNMVIDQLKKQGYQISEEKIEKDTIKLIGRRWVA
ncbi:MAG: DUF1257 domain-containing protein [Candidatus Omnitrophica bacterium]|nr:DUF1257 domain-containing protein [Candidatus Omnitrophota bacterium]